MSHYVIYFPSEKYFSDQLYVCPMDPSEPSESRFVHRSQIASTGHIWNTLVILLRKISPSWFIGETEQKWFVMDNDPSQRSKAAMKAINETGATLFAIPARSPDLNPIENLFHVTKSELEAQPIASGIQQESWHEFKARVKKTILETPVSCINNLLLSVPKRIRAVIKCKGLRTKY